MTNYLIGAGGWAYFPNPDNPSLELYSKIFNFVEVNQTFYEYPIIETVKRWRKTVPENFTFAVRCHQVLTHRLGFEPIDEAYYTIEQMVLYCKILDAPFLVLETPKNYVITKNTTENAKDLFSSWDLQGIRLVWEIRAPLTKEAINLMQDFNIIHCVDLSHQKPAFWSDTVYSRIFGKGTHNLYQFTDSELAEIDNKATDQKSKTVALSYHGAKMFTDATRHNQLRKTGKFMPVTPYIGVESVRSVLSEDAFFPASKAELIADQGWKIADLTANERVHLSEFLSKIPDRIYQSLDDVTSALKVTQ